MTHSIKTHLTLHCMVPVYWIAIKAIESLDGLGIAVRERRWQDRRHQDAEKCLSCDLLKVIFHA